MAGAASSLTPISPSSPLERSLRPSKGQARRNLLTGPWPSAAGQQPWRLPHAGQPKSSTAPALSLASGTPVATSCSRGRAGAPAVSQASWLQVQKQKPWGHHRGFVGGAPEGVLGSLSAHQGSWRSGWAGSAFRSSTSARGSGAQHTSGPLAPTLPWAPGADSLSWRGSSAFGAFGALGGGQSGSQPLPLGFLCLSTLGRRPGCHVARQSAAASPSANLGSGADGPSARGPRASGSGVAGTSEAKGKGAPASRKSKGSKASKASQGAPNGGGDSGAGRGRGQGAGSVDVVRRIVEAVPAQIPMREGPGGAGPAAGLPGAGAGQHFEGTPWPGLASLDDGSATNLQGRERREGGSEGVYLQDLLREHQGRLYVPQEAVALASSYASSPSPPSAAPPLSTAGAALGQGQGAGTGQGQGHGAGLFGALSAGERAAFEERMRLSPEMSHEQFEEFASKGQVLLLASRGLPAAPAGPPKGVKGGKKGRAGGEQVATYQYGVDTGGALLVLLRDAPGEKPLHTRTWVLRCGDAAKAEALLRRFKGQQLEVESAITAARIQEQVAVPTSAPLPAASTISGRLVLELSIVAGLLQNVLSFFLSIAGTIVGVAGTTAVAVVTKLLWPMVMKPLLMPAVFVSRALVLGSVNAAVGLWVWLVPASQAAVTNAAQQLFAGLAALTTELDFSSQMRRTALLQKMRSSGQTLAVILLVLFIMAAGAQYTLSRRTRDFKKWDIWQAIEFGQSKPQARVEGSTGVRFADVAGINEVVQELQELVVYLKDPDRFDSMGTKPPHGVLLEGPPGCGKTLLAKAIAGEAGVPFFQMAGSEFVEVLVGVGAARIRDLFKRAKVNKPAVVFIDEIDALGAVRAAGSLDDDDDGGVTERETTLNQLLIELDGFDTGQGVVFMAATNRMDLLDPALLRPGRFDRKITISPAGGRGRLDILKVHAKNIKLKPDVDLQTVANNLAGWSGAELANLLQEAALVAVRRGQREVDAEDVAVAAERLILGAPRTRLTEEQRLQPELVHRMAVREAGLALTAVLLRCRDREEHRQRQKAQALAGSEGGHREGLVAAQESTWQPAIEAPQRVSIMARGETSSWTVFDRLLDDEAYIFESHRTLFQRLQALLGGRAAEEVLWGRDGSTYTTEHVADATWLAYKLCSIWNAGGIVAPRGVEPAWQRVAADGSSRGGEGQRSGSGSGPVLSFEGSLYSTYGFTGLAISDSTEQRIGAQARVLVEEAYASTWALLQEHREALEDAVQGLLEVGELKGEELHNILTHHYGEMYAYEPPVLPDWSTPEEGIPPQTLPQDAPADAPAAGAQADRGRVGVTAFSEGTGRSGRVLFPGRSEGLANTDALVASTEAQTGDRVSSGSGVGQGAEVGDTAGAGSVGAAAFWMSPGRVGRASFSGSSPRPSTIALDSSGDGSRAAGGSPALGGAEWPSAASRRQPLEGAEAEVGSECSGSNVGTVAFAGRGSVGAATFSGLRGAHGGEETGYVGLVQARASEVLAGNTSSSGSIPRGTNGQWNPATDSSGTGSKASGDAERAHSSVAAAERERERVIQGRGGGMQEGEDSGAAQPNGRAWDGGAQVNGSGRHKHEGTREELQMESREEGQEVVHASHNLLCALFYPSRSWASETQESSSNGSGRGNGASHGRRGLVGWAGSPALLSCTFGLPVTQQTAPGSVQEAPEVVGAGAQPVEPTKW